jgi:uncharacterized Tic20 family protein
MEDTNTKDKIAAQLNKLIKIEDGPAFGQGSLSKEDDKLFCGLAHPFSLIIWLWKRKASPAVDAHGKEALNFGITYMLCVYLPLYVVMRLLVHILPVGMWWLVSLLMSLVGLALLAICIYGLILARQGKLLRYPFNLRLIK